jgi:ribulose-phosphate 3-epimerase
MQIKIAPSLLSADFADLTGSVRAVEAGGARFLHFDVMDGHFVPNITFGPMVVRALRPLTSARFLTHLMIYGAENYVEAFAKAGSDSITVHAEACTHLHRVVQQIRGAGASPGVALNPATPLSAVEYVIDDIDLLLVMTVNPRFGGQKFIEGMLPKIDEARRIVEHSGRNIDVAVDGGVDLETCERIVRAGANLLIAGNSVFNSPSGAAEAVGRLERCAVSSAEGSR